MIVLNQMYKIAKIISILFITENVFQKNFALNVWHCGDILINLVLWNLNSSFMGEKKQ